MSFGQFINRGYFEIQLYWSLGEIKGDSDLIEKPFQRFSDPIRPSLHPTLHSTDLMGCILTFLFFSSSPSCFSSSCFLSSCFLSSCFSSLCFSSSCFLSLCFLSLCYPSSYPHPSINVCKFIRFGRNSLFFVTVSSSSSSLPSLSYSATHRTASKAAFDPLLSIMLVFSMLLEHLRIVRPSVRSWARKIWINCTALYMGRPPLNFFFFFRALPE